MLFPPVAKTLSKCLRVMTSFWTLDTPLFNSFTGLGAWPKTHQIYMSNVKPMFTIDEKPTQSLWWKPFSSHSYTGADSGFQVRGAHLNFFGGYFVWKITILRQKNNIFSNFRRVLPLLDPPLVYILCKTYPIPSFNVVIILKKSANSPKHQERNRYWHDKKQMKMLKPPSF